MERFGTKQYAAIKQRLTQIMNKHLIPAGYEFQRVQYDFDRLRQGKELFDRNTVEALKTANDNNARYELLQRMKNGRSSGDHPRRGRRDQRSTENGDQRD